MCFNLFNLLLSILWGDSFPYVWARKLFSLSAAFFFSILSLSTVLSELHLFITNLVCTFLFYFLCVGKTFKTCFFLTALRLVSHWTPTLKPKSDSQSEVFLTPLYAVSLVHVLVCVLVGVCCVGIWERTLMEGKWDVTSLQSLYAHTLSESFSSKRVLCCWHFMHDRETETDKHTNKHRHAHTHTQLENSWRAYGWQKGQESDECFGLQPCKLHIWSYLLEYILELKVRHFRENVS